MSKSLLRLNMPPAKRTTEQLQLGNVQRHHVPGGITWALASTTVASNEIGTWTIPKESPAQIWGGGGALLDVDHHAYYIFTLDESGALWAVLQENLATASASTHFNLVAWVDQHNDLVPWQNALWTPGLDIRHGKDLNFFWHWNANGKLDAFRFTATNGFPFGAIAISDDGTAVPINTGPTNAGIDVPIPGPRPGTYDVWVDHDGNMGTDPTYIKIMTITVSARDWADDNRAVSNPFLQTQISPYERPTLAAGSRLAGPINFAPPEYETDRLLWGLPGAGTDNNMIFNPSPPSDGNGIYIGASVGTAFRGGVVTGNVPMETVHLPDAPTSAEYADPLTAYIFLVQTGAYVGNGSGLGVPGFGPNMSVSWSLGYGGGNALQEADHFNTMPPGSSVVNGLGFGGKVFGPQQYTGQLVGNPSPVHGYVTPVIDARHQWLIAPGWSIHVYPAIAPA